jgi:hypothetical protein
MTVTTFGKVAGINEIAAWNDQYGRLTGAASYRSFARDFAQQVPVTIDHDPDHQLGEVVHAELDERGDLWAVAVCDRSAADVLTEIAADAPLYYSGTFSSSGTESRSLVWVGHDARLDELAVTFTPARFGQRPVQILPGDVRSGFDRRQWTGTASRKPILDRAVTTIEERKGHCWPLQLLDLRPLAEERSAFERAGIPIRRDTRGRMIVTDEQGHQHTLELELR